MKYILVLLLGIALGVAGYLYFQNLQLKKEQVLPSPFPTSAPTITQALVPTENPITYGTVEGKICFPSSVVPEGNILAKNTKTGAIEKKYFEGVPPNNQEYTLTLKSGKYVFAYEIDGDPRGFYTPCALTGDIANCSTPESHKLTEVNVIAGETVTKIDLCDYYYPESEKPNF